MCWLTGWLIGSLPIFSFFTKVKKRSSVHVSKCTQCFTFAPLHSENCQSNVQQKLLLFKEVWHYSRKLLIAPRKICPFLRSLIVSFKLQSLVYKHIVMSVSLQFSTPKNLRTPNKLSRWLFYFGSKMDQRMSPFLLNTVYWWVMAGFLQSKTEKNSSPKAFKPAHLGQARRA